MTTAQVRSRPTGAASRARGRRDIAADEAFPPLTVSLAAFVKNGSDRELRRLIYSLFSLAALMERNRGYFAAYIGVSSAQSMMMAIVAEADDATVSGIAEQLSVSTQFVTMEINKLITKGIVEKRPNRADRRSMFLSLTAKGRTLLRELGPVRRKINDMTFRSLTDERARALQDMLDALVMDARNAVHALEAPDMRGRMAPTAQAGGAEADRDGRGGRAMGRKRPSGATGGHSMATR